ncbi:MAG: AMP-binding protein, partial [Muribaculaceae bacterium]|nr:AMP-binding protein [Muribaculaceae bacterium]
MMKENTIKIFEESFRNNWELPALSDYNTKQTLTYGDLARRIAQLHLIYKECGIKPGDRVALIGKNTPNWVIVFMGTITYGAVIVPILQEFNPRDAQHIINHSEAVLLFASNSIWESFDFDNMRHVRAAISLDNEQLLAQNEDENIDKVLEGIDALMDKTYPNGFTAACINYAERSNEKLMVINYTSGTTGFSKGVMLTGNNMAGNIVYGINSQLHRRGTRCVSFLPLAHAYGCAFDMLCPLAV